MFEKHKNAGIAIQSNLLRSESDIRRIASSGGIIRLVKGAYNEISDVAYSSRSEVTMNFSLGGMGMYDGGRWFALFIVLAFLYTAKYAKIWRT